MHPTTEYHPLQPFIPDNAVVLMLGSFPPPTAKWKMDFYYPNFQNDMWRIFGLVFFNDKEHFLTKDKTSFDKERIVRLLTEKRIAVYDTAREVIRQKGNASDNFLEIITPIDLAGTLRQMPDARTVVTTGEKATETLRPLFPDLLKKPEVGKYIDAPFNGQTYRFYRMPSSSRAYPKPLREKADVYARFFAEIGLL